MHINLFEISAPQCPTYYSPAGNGGVLDIVVHNNVQLSGVSEDTVSGILDWDRLSIAFHFLDHVTTRNISDPVEKFIDWEQFPSLASDLISPRKSIILGKKPVKRPTYFFLYHFGVQAINNQNYARALIRIYLVWSLLQHKWRLKKPGIQHVRQQSVGSPKSSDEWQVESH